MIRHLWLLCATIVAVAFQLAGGAQTNETVGIYELRKGKLSMNVTNYGARTMTVFFPDKFGKLDDVILGYDTVQEYMNSTRNFGATIGRVANRISNAQFTLNGTVYKLTPTSGNTTIHGGKIGYSKVIWKVKKYEPNSAIPRLVLSYSSYDGEEGFPGDLEVTVTYTLPREDTMSVVMKAKAINKATPVNIIQHPFWNLGGQASGDILSEEVQIFGSSITEVDSNLIPTGKIIPVKDTPYDFLQPRTVGSGIAKLPSGYDINYALDGDKSSRKLKLVAIVQDKKTGRRLEMHSNQPGVQFFTSNTLNAPGKGGFVYKPHAALCLETQGYPDAVNQPSFPSQIVNPGQTYQHFMLLKLSAH